ncbi:MAG: transporter substrate-binding domain-containing protein, partial [Opitutae bacterium]
AVVTTPVFLSAEARAGTTLDAIRARGAVVCGIANNQPAMSMPDSQGRWTGFHVEICRAFAVAIFNDPDRVRFAPVTAQQRFTALQSGEIDVLEGPNALTLTRDATIGLTTPVTVFYTGQCPSGRFILDYKVFSA